MPNAANHNITIDRGADWSKVLVIANNNGAPVSLANTVWKGEIKDPNDPLERVVATFAFDIISGGTTGQVRITLTKAESLKLQKKTYYTYDWFVSLNGVNVRLLEGEIDLQINTTTQP